MAVNPTLPFDQAPHPAEFGLRRAYFAKLQIPQSIIDTLIGPPGNSRNRGDASNDTISYIRALPGA